MARSRRLRHAGTNATEDETLGQRLARLRKERGFTQVELAERADTIQVVVSDYERGKLRPHPEMIVRLAVALGVTADELLGIEPLPKRAASPNRRILRRLEQIEKLPKRDQDAILRTIDAFLGKTGS